MFAINTFKQKNISTAIPVSIDCSQKTSGIIFNFSFVF